MSWNVELLEALLNPHAAAIASAQKGMAAATTESVSGLGIGAALGSNDAAVAAMEAAFTPDTPENRLAFFSLMRGLDGPQ